MAARWCGNDDRYAVTCDRYCKIANNKRPTTPRIFVEVGLRDSFLK